MFLESIPTSFVLFFSFGLSVQFMVIGVSSRIMMELSPIFAFCFMFSTRKTNSNLLKCVVTVALTTELLLTAFYSFLSRYLYFIASLYIFEKHLEDSIRRLEVLRF